MFLPKVALVQARNLIYALLILCVGGVAPLTFSMPLSPHRDVPTVYIALFDSPPHFSFTATDPDPITSYLKQVWSAQRFATGSKSRSFESFVPSLTHYFQSHLSSGYLLTVAQANLISLTSLFGLIAPYLFTGRSALLPPLEKPPQLFLT
jgi:hypothetical protein